MATSDYTNRYTPSLLEVLPRLEQRRSLGIAGGAPPFSGVDVWNAIEFTWLNAKGRPEVALARFMIPADSINIVESKSLKLYLGSYSNTSFSRRDQVINTLATDLTKSAGVPVKVLLLSPGQVTVDSLLPEDSHQEGFRLEGSHPDDDTPGDSSVESSQPGIIAGPVTANNCLDHLDVEISEFHRDPELLQLSLPVQASGELEILYSHLFRSLCPITGQPDLGSIIVKYSGNRISHEGLLKYLVSYREHAAFGEQIAEQIFMDIMNHCAPLQLAVSAFFNRRGGIDINVHRTSGMAFSTASRTWRQ